MIVADVQVDARLWSKVSHNFRMATIEKATITRCNVNTVIVYYPAIMHSSLDF